MQGAWWRTRCLHPASDALSKAGGAGRCGPGVRCTEDDAASIPRPTACVKNKCVVVRCGSEACATLESPPLQNSEARKASPCGTNLKYTSRMDLTGMNLKHTSRMDLKGTNLKHTSRMDLKGTNLKMKLT